MVFGDAAAVAGDGIVSGEWGVESGECYAGCNGHNCHRDYSCQRCAAAAQPYWVVLLQTLLQALPLLMLPKFFKGHIVFHCSLSFSFIRIRRTPMLFFVIPTFRPISL